MDDGSRARLEAARAGAGWALAELYHELHPRVLRYLRAMEPSEHEDLAADVWLETSHALQRFEGDEAGLRALAFTIARRRVLDLRRRRARRATSPVPQEQLVSTEAGDAEEDAMASLSTDEALRQILRLPPDQAQVILLRVIADLPVAEVASILEKTPGAVRALQHRAVRRLARQTSREAVTP
ncbi:MAG: sigma-70 family RNA polymerase sigma factor [Actinomycetota bacterium]